MKNVKAKRKYTPEISRKEIEDLKNTIKTASLKIIGENIERMKKADQHRPEAKAMKYFDNMSNLFGQRQQEIQARASLLLIRFLK
jgi:hypothetical protein